MEAKEQRLNPGDIVAGDFEILRLLGSGGMGSVYLCKQLSTEKVRAFKVMHSNFSREPTFVRRFEREARVGSRIHSAHIVEVVAAGIDQARGLPWLAMEYLEGLSLTDAMRQFGPPGASDATLLLDELWHAICAAHDAQVVHRDLKPDNLFVSQVRSPGRELELKVLDFGIAKWLSAVPERATMRALTQGWGAPEQAIHGLPIGPQADVWAMGLIVFWLWSGKCFWRFMEDFEALQKEVFEDVIPPASSRARELGCGALPQEFDAWFAACLSRNPNERFSNATSAYRAWSTIEMPWSTAAKPWRLSLATEFKQTELQSVRHDSAFVRNLRQYAELEAASAFPQVTEGTSTPLVGEARGTPETSATTRADRRRIVLVGGALVFGSLVSARFLGNRDDDSRLESKPPIGLKDSAPLLSLETMLEGRVPEGRFVFGKGGSSGVSPTLVSLTRPYVLDLREVSVGEYEACVSAGKCTPSAYVTSSGKNAQLDTQYSKLCNAAHPDRQQHPINCVTRQQAADFCAFRGQRLPTEAEWEFASRGPDDRIFPWGNQSPTSCAEAVVRGLCDNERLGAVTRPVGSRVASSAGPFGHRDLSGNVWEWVSDGWLSDPFQGKASEDPMIPASEQGVARGGSWDHPAQKASAVARQVVLSHTSDVNLGFRCARDLQR